MCDFCASHGGKTRWYLNPANFSKNLLEDKKRMKLLYELTGYGTDYYIDRTLRLGAQASSLGPIGRKIGDLIAPGRHSGQIVTTAEAVKILEIADNVCILECMCRRLIHGEKKMACINFGPVKELFEMLKPSEKIEVRPIDEVQELVRDFGSQGLYHQVLWAKIPYPIVICNCDLKYCTSAKGRFIYKIKSALLKGHYVSSVSEKCDGCVGEKEPLCIQKCPFKAMQYDSAAHTVKVNLKACFGCGVCQDVCPRRAIVLLDRVSIPQVTKSW